MMERSATGFVRTLLSFRKEGVDGSLTVRAQGVTTIIHIRKGRVISAEGGTVGETLGRLLVDDGVLTQEQYAEAIRVMTESLVDDEQMRLGEVLVKLGFMSVDDVQSALADQVRRKIAGCLRWDRMKLDFKKSSERMLGRFVTELEPTVLDGVHRFFPRERMQIMLEPFCDKYVTLKESADVSKRYRLQRDQMLLLRSLDGTLTTTAWLAENDDPADTAFVLLTTLTIMDDVAMLDGPPATDEADAPPAEESSPRAPTPVRRAPVPGIPQRSHAGSYHSTVNPVTRRRKKVPLAVPVERVAPPEAPQPSHAAAPAPPAEPKPPPRTADPRTEERRRRAYEPVEPAEPQPTPVRRNPRQPAHARPAQIRTRRVSPDERRARRGRPEPAPQPPAPQPQAQSSQSVFRRRQSPTNDPRAPRSMQATPRGIPADELPRRNRITNSALAPTDTDGRARRGTRTGAPNKRSRLEAERAFHFGLKHLYATRYEQALPQLEVATASLPNVLEYALAEAWCRFRLADDKDGSLDRRDELEELAERTLAQDPSLGLPPYIIGHLLMIMGDDEKALSEFERAFERAPDNRDAERCIRLLERRLTR